MHDGTSSTAKSPPAHTYSTAGTYTVTYRFDGFLQPINDTAHQVGQDVSERLRRRLLHGQNLDGVPPHRRRGGGRRGAGDELHAGARRRAFTLVELLVVLAVLPVLLMLLELPPRPLGV